MDDRQFMQMALALAARGEGFTSPNPMVGAVVVKDGRVVGQGFHRAVGGAHAEVNAIDAAGPLSRGATLYVTLEPCNHTGRTPPCTEKILAAGITRVVVAMPDPNPSVKGGGNAYLASRGLSVTCGICEAAARRLNESFVKYVQTGRPFVTVKCAATLDGRIATRTGDSRWVTGPESRGFVHRLRHAADAIMVGIDTVKTDNPSLTTRLDGAAGRDPCRIILDSHLAISENAKLLTQASDAQTLIVTGSDISAEKRARLEKMGARVLVSRLNKGHLDLVDLVDRLGRMEMTSLLIEGGGGVIGSALAAGIVDKVFFFYAPKILGGDDGVPVCRGPGPDRMNDCIRVDRVQVHRFGEDLMVEGYIDRR